MATTITDVLQFIRTIDLRSDDRKVIIAALNDQTRCARQAAKSQFRPGMAVEFTSKYGMPVRGKVTKVSRVNINVTDTFGQKWRVSPTLLKPTGV